jgi:hypothetical protein
MPKDWTRGDERIKRLLACPTPFHANCFVEHPAPDGMFLSQKACSKSIKNIPLKK